MTKKLRRVASVLVFVSVAWLFPRAQMRVVPVDVEQGHVALGLALRHLANVGIFMQADAHPDDENNGLLVLLNRGQGYRTALATATRGNGGQNEIGPELFEALGVLRTEELAAIHRFDGAEQYFTRAVDFGYSFSAEETQKNWGPDATIGDFVRLIRMVRPDVMIAQPPDQFGDGAQHPTAGLLSTEAAKVSGDSSKYPEQLKDGLRPWQPRKVYITGRNGNAAKQCAVNLAGFDSLLGRTYAEVGTEARSMHKCQGMAQLLALPGPATSFYQLAQTSIPGQQQRDERSLFDGVDTTITGLAQFAGPRPPKDLSGGLAAVASSVQIAQKKFDSESDDATVLPLVAGLRAVRVLRASLRNLPALADTARFEIDFRLRQKEREFQQAILFANNLRVDALADDGLVVPGQPVRVTLIVANRGAGEVALRQVRFDGFEGGGECTLVPSLRKDQVARCEAPLKVKADERVTEPYWHRADDAGLYTFDADAPFGLPYRPTPFYAQVTFGFPNGEDVIDGLPIQYRYQGNIFSGEKRSDLLVVPALSVRVSPEVTVVPAAPPPAPPQPTATAGASGRSGRLATPVPTTGRAPAKTPAAPSTPPAVATPEREIRVTVVNDSKGAAQSIVNLALPPGWSSTPAEQPIQFSREDESRTVRFQIKPGPGVSMGEYHARASATLAGQAYERGYQPIEYPHIRRQHIYHDADTTLKVLDVRTAPNLTVGYIMGVGDEVPAAIEQLGAKLEMIGPDELAWGNLSRFTAIVTGVRAYERREDLRANNSRLIDYVRDGGTLIVQYNKLEFNQAQYGPYPAQVGRGRVTDETAPVATLAPADPLFNTPNKITDATWSGWVQERGLYFLGEHDSRYRDLVSLEDPFPLNAGEKQGALVEAVYGKGRWIYVGLGLWRELPAGVPGAYQLLANLISLR
jgi:LmbE family N-acetylglucosaminyl deacetylase